MCDYRQGKALVGDEPGKEGLRADHPDSGSDGENVEHCGEEDEIAAEKQELVCDKDSESVSSSDSEELGRKRDLNPRRFRWRIC